MSDESFDMQGEVSAPVTPEIETPTVETPSATEEVATPQAEVPAVEEGTRAGKRIRELVAERDHYRELADLTSSRTSASNNQSPESPQVDPSTDETTQFQQIVRKAISDEVGDIRQGFRLQAAEREIDLVKAQFPDFDKLLPEVKEVLQSNESLRTSKNPIRDAYFMAKGMTTSQAVRAAKDAGRQEAYNTITQKGQSAVTAGGTPRPSNDPDQDLLRKFNAGQLTEQERKTNWVKIVNAMSAEK